MITEIFVIALVTFVCWTTREREISGTRAERETRDTAVAEKTDSGG